MFILITFSGMMAPLRVITLTSLAFSLIAPTAYSSDRGLVRFERGYKYEYQYAANVTLHQADTFKAAAKVMHVVYVLLCGFYDLK